MSEPKPNEFGVYEPNGSIILYRHQRTQVVARWAVIDGKHYLGMLCDTPWGGMSEPITKHPHDEAFDGYSQMRAAAIRKAIKFYEGRYSPQGSASERKAISRCLEKLREMSEDHESIQRDAKEYDMSTQVTQPKKAAKSKAKSTKAANDSTDAVPAPAKPPEFDNPVLIHPELIPLNMIDVEDNYRTKSGLSDASIAELAASMGEYGQRQPIEVEPVNGRYNLVFGNRRLRAAELLGWTQLSAIVLAKPLTPEEREAIRLVENEQHAETSPVEQCLAVGRLLDSEAVRRISPGATWTQLHKDLREEIIAAVAAKVGKSTTWVRDRAYIARLAPAVQSLVQDGQLPLEHARLISAVQDHADQMEIAEMAKVGAHGDEQPASLHDVKQMCGRRLFSLAQVPWKLDEAFAGGPACVECPSNSATMPGLFEHGGAASADPKAAASAYGQTAFDKEPKAGVCTNQSCFRAKYKACGSAISRVSAKAYEGMAAVPKAKKDAVQREVIRENAPAFVKPKAIEEKVQAKIELAKRNDGRAPKVEWSEADKKRMQEAEDRKNAERQLRDALQRRAKTIGPMIAKELAKRPGAWSVYMLFRMTKLFQDTGGNKAERVVNSPGMSALLKLLNTPSWDAVLEIEKQCGRQFSLIDEWNDSGNGMADKIAAALGIELDAAPTLHDFLPKDHPDKATPEKAKPETKPTAKRKGKAASEKGSDEDDGDTHAGFSEERDE